MEKTKRLVAQRSCPMLTTALLLLISFESVDGNLDNYQWYCNLNFEPIVDVEWDPISHRYVIDKQESSANDGERHRRLGLSGEQENKWLPLSALGGSEANSPYEHHHERALSAAKQQAYESASNRVNNTINNQNSNHTTNIIQARLCSCWKNPRGLPEEKKKNFYCPLPRTHCGVGGANWEDVRAGAYPQSSSGSSSIITLIFDDPGCLDISGKAAFAKNLWPMIIVW
jgi:hypothetical protein